MGIEVVPCRDGWILSKPRHHDGSQTSVWGIDDYNHRVVKRVSCQPASRFAFDQPRMPEALRHPREHRAMRFDDNEAAGPGNRRVVRRHVVQIQP